MMTGYSRAELARAYETFKRVSDKCAAAADYNAFADLFTEDCIYLEHVFGEMHGREAVRAWIVPLMQGLPPTTRWSPTPTTGSTSTTTTRGSCSARAPTWQTPATVAPTPRPTGPGSTTRGNGLVLPRGGHLQPRDLRRPHHHLARESRRSTQNPMNARTRRARRDRHRWGRRRDRAAPGSRRARHGRPGRRGRCLESRAESVAAKLTALGHAALARVVDVGDRTSVRTLAIECATLGRVTSVAHTAGVSPMQADIATILRVDLVGTALVLEEFGAVVAAGGAGVVVASMAGQIFGPHLSEDELVNLAHDPAESLEGLSWFNRVQDPQTAYGYAKRGNQARVVAAAASWAARGARVNSISPGVIDTEMGNVELTRGHRRPGARPDRSLRHRPTRRPRRDRRSHGVPPQPRRLLHHRHGPARRRRHHARLPAAGRGRLWAEHPDGHDDDTVGTGVAVTVGRDDAEPRPARRPWPCRPWLRTHAARQQHPPSPVRRQA